MWKVDMAKKKKKKWIKGAIKRPGSFKAAAKRAGMSVSAFITHVLSHKGKYSSRMRKKAILARTLKGFKKKK
jgi:hypothetical protein